MSNLILGIPIYSEVNICGYSKMTISYTYHVMSQKRQKDAEVTFYEDMSEKPWYNLNNSKNGDKEIMIVSRKEGSARPLSYYSNIVKNIGDVKQIRIYVKPEDRLRAEEVLR